MPALASGTSETEELTQSAVAEFMKGFRALDRDGDGAVDLSPMLQGLRSIGYGNAASARGGRGRGGGRRGGGSDGPGGLQSDDLEFATTLDGNRDGTLTEAEAEAAVRADFSEAMEDRTSLDADGDGRIEPREYALSQPRTGGPVDDDGIDRHARGHFNREDFDRDGVISTAEIAQRVYPAKMRRYRAMQLGLRVARLDADGDGQLTSAELSAGGTGLREALEASAPGPLDVTQLYPVFQRTRERQSGAVEAALSSN